MTSWAESVAAFGEAAAWFADAARAAAGHEELPGLGEWTVRDLVGHTSRALVTVESYLDTAADGVELVSAAQYFERALATLADPARVAQRGRDAASELGADPAEAAAALVARVTARVRGSAADDLVATPVGGMRLLEYLPTRTVELTVHTCDLCVALRAPIEVPAAAARESLVVLGDLAARSGLAAPLLLAMTGRRGLPDGFTVLGRRG